MAALGGREEGRKERTKYLPPPPKGAAQRRWRSLMRRWNTKGKEKEKLLSRERRVLCLRIPL
jgi:hypothetical protein